MGTINSTDAIYCTNIYYEPALSLFHYIFLKGVKN